METVMNKDLGVRKWYALGALALSLLVVGLDLTVLNVALPTLATDLGASTGQLQWFADAYNLVLAAAPLRAQEDAADLAVAVRSRLAGVLVRDLGR
jgi:MFS family permease